ncbi:hypothetical protein [Demequina silvatica]|uniref:hypothetical protein n=1 Tax=Demequina silvatica TaxID=1638988 RepID=UPI000785293C|nr:hypothetical protein [Demequina silvatica]
MSHEGYALDVGWLIGHDDADVITLHRVLSAIEAMRSRGSNVLLDFDGHIEGEYARHLQPGMLGRKIYAHVHKAQMLLHVSGKLTQKSADALDKACFDPSDRPYLGAASSGCGAYVTHEEKHLRDEQSAAIQSACGVPVLGTEEFFEDLGV